MRKLLALSLVGVMAASMMFGCGKSEDKKSDPDFKWTKEGTFMDKDENGIIITASEEKADEWAVTLVIGEDFYGGILKQEGNTLHGNVTPDEEKQMEITVSEDGENEVKVETGDGGTFKFSSEGIPEATMAININTEGMGQIAYAKTKDEIEFEEDYPSSSAQINLAEPETYVFAAKADEGWKFVKWTKDGEDFSTDEVVEVELTETAEFIAVFEEE